MAGNKIKHGHPLKLAPWLMKGTFIRRVNRFLAWVEVGGTERGVHVRSSARMAELLVKGRRILVAPSASPGRKTSYTLLLVQFQDIWVSVDSTLPNRLIHEALRRGELRPFAGYSSIQSEVVYGRSRFDFRLQDPGECLVEVKSVTLVRDGVALFPDAPSTRGRKHMEELAAAVESGIRAAVVFVVQREDGTSFAPNEAADPEFAHALRHAAASGVEIYALGCTVRENTIRWERLLPVKI